MPWNIHPKSHSCRISTLNPILLEYLPQIPFLQDIHPKSHSCRISCGLSTPNPIPLEYPPQIPFLWNIHPKYHSCRISTPNLIPLEYPPQIHSCGPNIPGEFRIWGGSSWKELSGKFFPREYPKRGRKPHHPSHSVSGLSQPGFSWINIPLMWRMVRYLLMRGGGVGAGRGGKGGKAKIPLKRWMMGLGHPRWEGFALKHHQNRKRDNSQSSSSNSGLGAWH